MPSFPTSSPSRRRPAGNRAVEDCRSLSCLRCGHRARLPVRFAGRRIRCPACAAEFRFAEDASRLIAVSEKRGTPSAKAVEERQASVRRGAKKPVPKHLTPPAPPVRRQRRRPRSAVPPPRHTVTGRTSVGAPVSRGGKTLPGFLSRLRGRLTARKWVLTGCTIFGLALTALVLTVLTGYSPGNWFAGEQAKEELADASDAAGKTRDAGGKRPSPATPAGQTKKGAGVAPGGPQTPANGSPYVQLNALNRDLLKGVPLNRPAAALQQKDSLTVTDRPLLDVLQRLAKRHRLVMVVDVEALTDEGIPLQQPVTVSLQEKSLDEVLTAVLGPLLLKHVLPRPDAEAIVVTSEIKALGTDVNSLLERGAALAANNPAPRSLPSTSPPSRQRRPSGKPKRKPKPSPTDWKTAFRNGRRLLKQRKYDQAIAAFSQVIRQRRNDAQAWYYRGYAYLLKQENGKAVKDLNTALRLRRNYADAYAARAIAYQRMGYGRRARDDRVRAARLRRKKS